MPWVRIDVDVDTHPDMMLLDGWAYVALTAAVRIVKQFGSAGWISHKHLSPSVMARRCLFGFSDGENFSDGLAQLVDAGIIVDHGEEYEIPGWHRYQEDSTNAERQRRYRSRKAKPDASRNVTRVTLRNANNDDGTGHDMTGHIEGDPPNGHDLDEPPESDSTPDPAPPQKPTDPVDWAALRDEWNAATADAPGATGLRTWTDARKAGLRARAKEMGTTPAEAWAWVCAEVRTTPLLRGDTGREGRHASWRVSPDWVLKPANWSKISEGRYPKDPPPAASRDVRPYDRKPGPDRWAHIESPVQRARRERAEAEAKRPPGGSA